MADSETFSQWRFFFLSLDAPHETVVFDHKDFRKFSFLYLHLSVRLCFCISSHCFCVFVFWRSARNRGAWPEQIFADALTTFPTDLWGFLKLFYAYAVVVLVWLSNAILKFRLLLFTKGYCWYHQIRYQISEVIGSALGGKIWELGERKGWISNSTHECTFPLDWAAIFLPFL